MKRTIALLDTNTGWAFRLHSDDRRVWLDAFPSSAPVPISFIAGDRAAELEFILGSCPADNDLVAAARRVLPDSVEVLPLEEIAKAA